MIHVDTSFLIRALADGTPYSVKLDQWIADGLELGISAPAWCEFMCGPVTSHDIVLAQRAIGMPLAFLVDDAVLASELFNLTGRRRGSLLDCMIAAVAIRSGAVLATDNVQDFNRFELKGLQIV